MASKGLLAVIAVATLALTHGKALAQNRATVQRNTRVYVYGAGSRINGSYYSRDASGRLVTQPATVYGVSRGPAGTTVEIGPKQKLNDVTYLGDPQSTQKLPDGSTLYTWDLRRYKLDFSKPLNVHPHYLLPPGTQQIMGGTSGKTLWILCSPRAVNPSDPAFTKMLQQALGTTNPVVLGGQ